MKKSVLLDIVPIPIPIDHEEGCLLVADTNMLRPFISSHLRRAYAVLPVAIPIAAAVACLVLRRRRQRRLLEPSAMPPALIISLKRFPAARKAVLQRASEAGIGDVKIFEAVEGRELSVAELRRRGVRTYDGWRLPGSKFRFFDRELKWGEVGCALSHVGVWKFVAGLDEASPVAVVLEDDVDFAPRFAELLRDALDEVRALTAAGKIDEPDALYLGRRAMRPEHDRVLPRAREEVGAGAPSMRLVVPGFSYKTTAYVLWRSGARKLLASGFEGKLIPVDDFLALTYAPHEAKAGMARPDLDALFVDAPRLNMLAVRPNLCWERRGISSTENSPFICDEQGRSTDPPHRGNAVERVEELIKAG